MTEDLEEKPEKKINMSETPKVQRYFFDQNDFSDDKKDDEILEVTYTEAELEQARIDAATSAYQKGLTEAKNSQNEHIKEVTDKMSIRISALIQNEERREVEKFEAITNLTIQMAKKLFPDMARKQAFPEIENLIKVIMEDRHQEPRMVLIVNPSLLEPFKQSIEKIGQAQGFSGKLIVMPDDELQISNCRIEWADGGAHRDFDDLFSHIENAMKQSMNNLAIDDDEV